MFTTGFRIMSISLKQKLIAFLEMGSNSLLLFLQVGPSRVVEISINYVPKEHIFSAQIDILEPQ